ncbi:hypothetical protein Acr_10g0001080 [Actinidia rufa]|uniref:Uncharacterized protein n=1 Tax=Actinidia rufa TaxID=165716 RepID=A0A7J0F804_9ERIC|nr:hypothetical protein Acr_10g0001080 [Actinidia rufa]
MHNNCTGSSALCNVVFTLPGHPQDGRQTVLENDVGILSGLNPGEVGSLWTTPVATQPSPNRSSRPPEKRVPGRWTPCCLDAISGREIGNWPYWPVVTEECGAGRGAISGGSEGRGGMVMELFGKRMVGRDFGAGGFAEYMVKDLGMVDVVEEEGEDVVVLPGAALSKQLFSGMGSLALKGLSM